MVWCLDHATSSEEIVECITESLSILQTPLPKKVCTSLRFVPVPNTHSYSLLPDCSSVSCVRYSAQLQCQSAQCLILQKIVSSSLTCLSLGFSYCINSTSHNYNLASASKSSCRRFSKTFMMLMMQSMLAWRQRISKWVHQRHPETMTDHGPSSSWMWLFFFQQKVMSCFRAWEDWTVYPNEFLIKLQNIFLGLTKQENSPRGDGEIDVDGAPLPDEDVDGMPLDGSAFRKAEDDIDGAALDDEDVDGIPLGADVDGEPCLSSCFCLYPSWLPSHGTLTYDAFWLIIQWTNQLM